MRESGRSGSFAHPCCRGRAKGRASGIPIATESENGRHSRKALGQEGVGGRFCYFRIGKKNLQPSGKRECCVPSESTIASSGRRGLQLELNRNEKKNPLCATPIPGSIQPRMPHGGVNWNKLHSPGLSKNSLEYPACPEGTGITPRAR